MARSHNNDVFDKALAQPVQKLILSVTSSVDKPAVHDRAERLTVKVVANVPDCVCVTTIALTGCPQRYSKKISIKYLTHYTYGNRAYFIPKFRIIIITITDLYLLL